MQTVDVKLVTIVAESVLAKRLFQMVKTAGATGYTVSDASGTGSRDMRASTLDGENIRIETLVSPEVAETLLEVLVRDWFPHYAVIAWISDVAVVRGEKYAASG